MNKKYLELTKLIRSKQNDHEILKCLSNYHENDIADMLTVMTPKERKRIYTLLGPQKIAEIFAYLDEPQIYFSELSVKDAAKVVSLMDSDDAVDVLETLDDKKKYEIVENLDKAAIKDVKMLLSYDDDEIGSCMTTNYICIPKGLSVRQAMSELVRQAGTNDNISTIYVLDESLKFAGAIDLKDLIIARKHDVLDDIIVHSYPSVTDHEKIDDCMEKSWIIRKIPFLSCRRTVICSVLLHPKIS